MLQCPTCGSVIPYNREYTVYCCPKCNTTFIYVEGFQTIEEYNNAVDIQAQVQQRLLIVERNRQLWGGKYCGRIRKRRRKYVVVS